LIDSQIIKSEALELGFSACGISKADALPLSDLYQDWIEGANHGEMKFLERNIDLRLDPGKLFEGAQSVIVLLASYYNKNYTPADPLKVSRYAVGRDYHKVLKKKGQNLINWMKKEYDDCEARVFVDSAPIMEKEWARRAGLGWIGKNTCLILPSAGSWFFISIILTNIEISPDKAEMRNLCGNCTRCIDACPTKAIHPDGYVDAKKCISYLTIELKEDISGEFHENTNNWLFGCDICQDICPYNRFSIPSEIDDFQAREIIHKLSPEVIRKMSAGEFDLYFSGSPLKRAGLEKLKTTSAFLYPSV